MCVTFSPYRVYAFHLTPDAPQTASAKHVERVISTAARQVKPSVWEPGP